MATPTLLAHVAGTVLAPILRKSWFSGEYVRVDQCLSRAEWLYEAGAALGYCFRDRLGIFVQLFSKPGQEAIVTENLANDAAMQSAQAGKEPRDFYVLYVNPEVERLMSQLREVGRTRCSAWSDFDRVAKKRLLIPDGLAVLEKALFKGIAIGSHYPDLAKTLFAAKPNPEMWSQLRGKNRDWPESAPEPRSVVEVQSEAITLIRSYLETFRFDLLAPLGLWFDGEDGTLARWRALMARRSSQS